MKKIIIIACLLLLFILQASIFVAFATEQVDIKLKASKSNYDYFGDAYKIEVSGGEFSVDFENQITGTGFLTLYVYSPVRGSVIIKPYNDSDNGTERAITFRQNETKLINLPLYDIGYVSGLVGECESDYLIFSCIQLSQSMVNSKTYELDTLAFSHKKTFTADYVDVEYSVRSTNQIKSIDVVGDGNFTKSERLIRAERKSQDYFLTVTVTDVLDRVESCTITIPKSGEINDEFALSGGTVNGSSDGVSFAKGAKEYLLNINQQSGMEFEFSSSATDLTVITNNGELSDFCSEISYTFYTKCNQVRFVSSQNFELHIKNLHVINQSSDQVFPSLSIKSETIVMPDIQKPTFSETGVYDIGQNVDGITSVYYIYDGKKIVSQNLDGKKEGIYQIFYEYASGGTVATVSHEIVLTDTTAPSIACNYSNELEYGERYDLTDFSVDDLSGFVLTFVLYKDGSIENVDSFSEFVGDIGSYVLECTAIDLSSNQNSSIYRHEFEIKDTTPPTLTEFICDDEIEVLSEIEPVITCSDLSNVEIKTYYVFDNLPYEFESSFVLEKIGEYEVFVECKDEHGNVTSDSKTVVAVDTEKPEIELSGEIEFDSENFFSFSSFEIEDRYDSYPVVTIIVTYNGAEINSVANGIFYQGYGEYVFSVIAVDGSGNSNQKEYTLTLENPTQNVESPTVEPSPTIRDEGVFGCSANSKEELLLVLFILVGAIILRKI